MSFFYFILIPSILPFGKVHAARFEAAGDTLTSVKTIFELLINIGFALSFVLFLWGCAKYILSNGIDSRKSAKGLIINGLVGLFVLFSIGGIVKLIQGGLGVV